MKHQVRCHKVLFDYYPEKIVNAILPDGAVRTQSHPKTASVKIDDEQPIKLDEVGTRYAPHATALIEAAAWNGFKEDRMQVK